MSNIQLESEINSIIKNSGYSKSKNLFCPIMRVVSMKYKDVPLSQVHKVLKDILC